ncbi:MAG: NUDIX hydrolase [Chloroflexota bacterium]
MNEKILSTKTIFDGRLLRVRHLTVELPDGTQAQREVLKHPCAAAIVPLDENNNVLLVKQFRIGAGQIFYEIPAGLLEQDEDPRDTAIRECREETGYRPLNVEPLGGMYLAPGYSDEYIHLFYATGLEHAPLDQDTTEFVTPERLPFTQALNMIDDGTITEAKTIAALLRVARKLNIS